MNTAWEEQPTEPLEAIQPHPSISYITIGVGLGLVWTSCVVLIGIVIWLSGILDSNNNVNKPSNTPESATATAIVVLETAPVVLAMPTNEIPSVTISVIAINTPLAIANSPSATYTFSPPTPLPPTSTPTLTNTPSLTATPTLTPSATVTPSLTLTITAIPQIIAATNTLLPPSPLPQGRLVRLFYDNSSFYLYNTTIQQISSASLAFEAVGDTSLRFEGNRWAQFYGFIEGGNCVAIEVTTGPTWLRPSQCRFYNAIVTPQTNSRLLFWLIRGGISQFRVLWNEQEVGRCTIGAGTCEVYLPQ